MTDQHDRPGTRDCLKRSGNSPSHQACRNGSWPPGQVRTAFYAERGRIRPTARLRTRRSPTHTVDAARPGWLSFSGVMARCKITHSFLAISPWSSGAFAAGRCTMELTRYTWIERHSPFCEVHVVAILCCSVLPVVRSAWTRSVVHRMGILPSITEWHGQVLTSSCSPAAPAPAHRRGCPYGRCCAHPCLSRASRCDRRSACAPCPSPGRGSWPLPYP